MSIAAAGHFDYAVFLTRDAGKWIGRAARGIRDSGHPGLVGTRPNLELSDGMVTLHRTESAIHVAVTYTQFERPARLVSIPVGALLEAVAKEGDLLRLRRGGTGDIGITLFRGDDFLMGLGAVVGLQLAPTMTIHEDPRAAEVELYYAAKTVDQPDTAVVWLDPADPNLEATINNIDRLPGERLIVAITGPSAKERRELNRRVAWPPVSSKRRSTEYISVEPRFTSCEQWVAYLRQLPTTRPKDLYLRFGFDDEEIDVREGGHAFKRPWHLFVAKVYTPGIPGEWSQLAVVREHQAIDVQTVIDSTRLVASGRLEMTD